MRAVLGMISLSRGGSVHLPDTGCVEVRGIHSARAVRKNGIQHLKAPLHQVPAFVIVWQIDPVEEVGTIPRVGHDRGRPPAFSPKVRGDFRCPDQGCLVLFIGRGHARRTNRIDIDRKPPAAKDVAISGRRVLPPKLHLHAVCPAGEECRVHLVQCEVDPLDLWDRIQGLCRTRQQVQVVKVSAVNVLVGDRPKLYYPRL